MFYFIPKTEALIHTSTGGSTTTYRRLCDILLSTSPLTVALSKSSSCSTSPSSLQSASRTSLKMTAAWSVTFSGWVSSAVGFQVTLFRTRATCGVQCGVLYFFKHEQSPFWMLWTYTCVFSCTIHTANPFVPGQIFCCFQGFVVRPSSVRTLRSFFRRKCK